jgi:hypothetical protein
MRRLMDLPWPYLEQLRMTPRQFSLANKVFYGNNVINGAHLNLQSNDFIITRKVEELVSTLNANGLSADPNKTKHVRLSPPSQALPY